MPVNMARTQSADQKAYHADDQEIAQDIRRVDTVVGLGVAGWVAQSISSSCRFKICLAETQSLVQQRFIRCLGKRIGETIAAVLSPAG